MSFMKIERGDRVSWRDNYPMPRQFGEVVGIPSQNGMAEYGDIYQVYPDDGSKWIFVNGKKLTKEVG